MINGTMLDRNHALKIIYQANTNIISNYILKNSGSIDEAKDLFQETMIAFYENVRDNKFKGESAISTYLYSIAKFKWLNQIKKNNIRTSHHEKLKVNEFEESPLVTLMDKEKSNNVIHVLTELGEPCKKLLIATIYQNASMKEIVELGEYSSEQIVRNKKYKCLQKLKELINAKPALMQILKENG
jgi:RNA polymerase sigma factor (sigma-70 family)